MIRVGSARIDENGNTHGGKPGDQTGKEVSTQEYYTHKKGWLVLRPLDPEKAERIAKNMEYACANDHWGYDQYNRTSGMNCVSKFGYDASKLSENKGTDCSNLVRVCCLYAGINVGDFTTSNEANALLNTKEFTLVNVPMPGGLRRGDVLVTKTKGHTVVVLDNGGEKSYKVGWNHDSNGWWYAVTPAIYLKSTWKVINHHWYYFGDDGYIKTEWAYIDNKWYYFQPDGELEGALYHESAARDGSLEIWYVD